VRRCDARYLARLREWRLNEFAHDSGVDVDERPSIESIDERDEAPGNLEKSTAALFAQPLRGELSRDCSAKIGAAHEREPFDVLAGRNRACG
jgi:hypothetical protein